MQNWISSKAVMEDGRTQRDPEPDPEYSGYAQDHERDVPDIFDEIKESQKRTGRDGAVFLCIAKCHPAYPEASAEHGKSYFEKEGHQSKKTGLLVISGDKGLAGAYNHNIMKMADTFLKDPSREVHLFVIGETGRQFFASQHIPIEENFQYTAQDPTFNRARWIAGILLERYLSGDLDEIHVLYTRMENVMQSVAKDKRVLPITKPDMHGMAIPVDVRLEEFSLRPTPGGSDECDRSELCSRIYLRRAG